MFHKIRNYYITSYAILSTLYISLRAVIGVFILGYNRRKTDIILQNWARSLLKRSGVKYEVITEQPLILEEGRAYIVMCNHTSLFDIPLAYIAIPGSLRMLTKKELFKVPVWGRAMMKTEFITIDRDNRRQALMDMKNASEKLKTGLILWVGPEGTRSKDGKLLPFKKGAFKLAITMKATIIPMGISGIHKVLSSGSLDFHTNHKVEVRIGKPVEASQYSNKTRDKLVEEIETQIRKLSGQPLNQ